MNVEETKKVIRWRRFRSSFAVDDLTSWRCSQERAFKVYKKFALRYKESRKIDATNSPCLTMSTMTFRLYWSCLFLSQYHSDCPTLDFHELLGHLAGVVVVNWSPETRRTNDSAACWAGFLTTLAGERFFAWKSLFLKSRFVAFVMQNKTFDCLNLVSLNFSCHGY